MNSRPLVSVIVPAYNAVRHIEQALASAREQTYEHVEIIVVDDGSRDATATLVARIAEADPRVVLLRQENAGVAAARNRGIAAARGAFIAPLDADDVWYASKLQRQVDAILRAEPSVGVVYCGWDVITGEGRRIRSVRPSYEGDVADVLVRRNIIACASTPLIRRACLDHVGGYDTQMKEAGHQGCEDWDLYLRLAEHYRFVSVPDCLLAYRKEGGSMSSSHVGMEASYLALLERLRARRQGVSEVLYRRSRQNFYVYLARICTGNRNYRGMLQYLYRAFAADPVYCLASLPTRKALSTFRTLFTTFVARG